MSDNKEEKYLIEIITRLQEEYTKAAKPYYERLAQIHSTKPIQITISIDQAKELGVINENNIKYERQRT